MTDQEIKHSDMLKRIRSFPPPPPGFDPRTASQELLRRHGFPRRPDPKAEPRLARLFDQAAARPVNYVRAEFEATPKRHRNPLGNPLGKRGGDAGTTGWAGFVVAPQFGSGEAASWAYGKLVVPDISPMTAVTPSEMVNLYIWVGLDGADTAISSNILQAGVLTEIQPSYWNDRDATLSWTAWAEWYYPEHQGGPMKLTNFPVRTGDVVGVLVCAWEPNVGYVWIQNMMTGHATSGWIDAPPKPQSEGGGTYTVDGSSAEWIVEGHTPALPPFDPVLFVDCTGGGNPNWSFDLSDGSDVWIRGSMIDRITDTQSLTPYVFTVNWEGWA